jgi:hypothetical protein
MKFEEPVGKDRRFRDRRTKEQRLKDTLKESEKRGPVHEPYFRERINWKEYYNEKAAREDLDATS